VHSRRQPLMQPSLCGRELTAKRGEKNTAAVVVVVVVVTFEIQHRLVAAVGERALPMPHTLQSNTTTRR
jgi:hypothetical protein